MRTFPDFLTAPGKTARSKPAFPDEILTLIRATRPASSGLVRVSSGLILTPFLVRIDFNPNKVSSGSILTPFLVRIDFNPISCPD